MNPVKKLVELKNSKLKEETIKPEEDGIKFFDCDFNQDSSIIASSSSDYKIKKNLKELCLTSMNSSGSIWRSLSETDLYSRLHNLKINGNLEKNLKSERSKKLLKMAKKTKMKNVLKTTSLLINTSGVEIPKPITREVVLFTTETCSNKDDSPRNMTDSDEYFIPAYCTGYTKEEQKSYLNKKVSCDQKSIENFKKTQSFNGKLSQTANPQFIKKRTSEAEHNWQCTKSNIKERLAFMFNNELLADVHFLLQIKSEKENKKLIIPAHKFILSINSSVFDAMFNGHMADQNAVEIEITDIEPAAFLNLMKFFYTDQVSLCPETVMATLYAAKKYAAVVLEFACVDYLKKKLTGENACMLLGQARLFDEPQLAATCLEVIDHSTLESINSDSFVEIDLQTLCLILRRDTLEIHESSLFSAVLRWAESEIKKRNLDNTPLNLRNVLGESLFLIRFPLMSIEEFASGPAQSGLLTDKEVIQLFLYFTAKPRPLLNYFSDFPRSYRSSKEEVVLRFGKVERRWGYSGHTDRIKFMVNKKIFATGLGLYGSIHDSAKYLATIQILHSDSRSVCGENDVVFSSDGSSSTVKVSFKEPIEISPEVSYTLCATIQGPDSYYGAKGLRKVVSAGVTFQFSYNAGNNNGTSVEDGQLPEIYFYT